MGTDEFGSHMNLAFLANSFGSDPDPDGMYPIPGPGPNGGGTPIQTGISPPVWDTPHPRLDGGTPQGVNWQTK